MNSSTLPRVLYCGHADGVFRKLERQADGFLMEAGNVAFTGSPQKLAAARKAAALILKVRNELAPEQRAWLASSDGSVPILVLCQNGTLESAVQALQYRIFDYFCLNQPAEEIGLRIREAALRKSARRFKRPLETATTLLHGHNPEIRRINQEAKALVKDSRTPVVLCGEAGTGKEHLAYGMYRISGNRNLPFIRYDCRLIQQVSKYDGIPVSGFILTGLRELKKRHRGGTLFLQHLEVVEPPQQMDILNSARESSIHLIASCQQTRTDHERSSDIPHLKLPALRQHPDDVVPLAEHFIQLTAKSLNIPAKSLSPETIALMQEYAWPGNIQELSNVIDRMMITEPSAVISPHSWRVCQGFGFQWTLRGANRFAGLIEEALKSTAETLEEGALYDQFMARMKRLLIDLVLPRVDYNQANAAKILGISRNTLRDILRQA